MLNNPLANSNPDAVIVATFNQGRSTSVGIIAPPGVLSVYYDDANNCGNALNRWVLVNKQSWQASSTQFTGLERFKIYVAAP